MEFGSLPTSAPSRGRRHKRATTTLQRAEQAGVLMLGCGLLAYGVSRRSTQAIGARALALPLLFAGLAGARSWPGRRDTRAALGGNKGVHVRESVRINRPIADVYREWKRVEHLPAMMAGLERVENSGRDRSHWTVRGPGNLRLEWDAEVINDEPEKVIGWRTLPGADVQCAGSVRFDEAPGGRGTQVTVHLQYSPPAGRVGAAVARLAGRDPAHEVREGLRQFKQTLEAGERARVASATGEMS